MKKIIICGVDVHEKTLVSKIAVSRETPEDKDHGNTRVGRQQLIKYLKHLAKKHVNIK